MSHRSETDADGGRFRTRKAALPVRALTRRRGAAPVRGDTQLSGSAGTANSSIVDCGLYADGYRRGGQLPLGTAFGSALDTADGFVWIGLHAPSAEELAAVAAEFDLPPLAVEDAVHAHQRPKIELYDDVLFVVLKTVRYIDPTEVVDVGEVMLFIGARFVVSVRHGHASGLTEVRRRLEANTDLLRTGPSAVLHALSDHVVDEYALAIEGISTDIDEIELQVFSGGRAAPTERLYKLKREVMDFHRAVRPLVAVMDRVVNGNLALLDRRSIEYFRDVHDHVLRAAEDVDTFGQLLTGALSANLAQIQMRDNDDMRKIAAWVAILSANTMVAGVYGMNFTHMPELGWALGYPMALTLMLTISVFLYRGFRRNHWI